MKTRITKQLKRQLVAKIMGYDLVEVNNKHINKVTQVGAALLDEIGGRIKTLKRAAELDKLNESLSHELNEATNKVNKLHDDVGFLKKCLGEVQGQFDKAIEQRDELETLTDIISGEFHDAHDKVKELEQANDMLLVQVQGLKDGIRVTRIFHTALFITEAVLVLVYVALKEGWLV